MIDRRRVAAALAAGAFLLLAPLSACGGDDDSADVASTTVAGDGEPIAGSDDSTTTTADDTAEDDGGEPIAGSDDSTTTEADDTAEDDGGEPIAGSGDEAAEEEAEGDGWDRTPFTYRGQDGRRIGYTCSAGGTLGSVWGTEVYTDDSSVCSAAVHAGLITVEDGGRVVIEIAPGEEEYEGSDANGVESSDYGAWAGSFTFPTS